ncbi:hypothetical protein FHETE_8840 [Fusarium heterosporum]|uniref:Uncharacterized protein n=1 Tax=Fusarium heterosporum TaxID=42747 RepID=A0A8H5WFH9_FUSHE|nr:hypothetical protein FHETE_8840 [Fusarium heterosporum]
MVRNNPTDPFQRSVIVDRASQCGIQADLAGVIHGSMSPGKEPATLLVFEFKFRVRKRDRRIKSASVTISFHGGNDDPAVVNFAPSELSSRQSVTEFAREVNAEIGIPGAGIVDFGGPGRTTQWQSNDSAKLQAIKSFKPKAGSSDIAGQINTVTWTMLENTTVRSGLPPYLKTAILLQRRTDEKFLATISIETDVSGFSFRDFQGDILGDRVDDPVFFDPRAPPQWYDGPLELNNLGSIDLSSLSRWVDSADMDQEWNNVQADDAIESETVIELVSPNDAVDSKSKSWSIDLWDTNITMESRTDLPSILKRKDLEKYFSWISESLTKPPLITSNDADGNREVKLPLRGTDLFNLIARQSDETNLTASKLKDLLSEPPIDVLSGFIQLPGDLEISQSHDRGSCQIFTDPDGSRVQKEYIIQTPFYRTGFWSLVLYSLIDLDVPRPASKLSGIIQADAGVDFSSIFSEVRKLAEKHGRHQSLLPIQLFKVHFAATLKSLQSIQDRVEKVDEELLRQFEQEGNLGEASKLYRSLSMVLHQCSMELAELRRRRSFEDDLRKQLLQDLQSGSKLTVMMDLYSKMSKSLDLDVEALPGKIESQRNVLFNLITQHDSFLQAKLAREALRDSKAMKTLSVLTILFLPGAFVATVFSTNMFTFKSNGQQIWIYFAIVTPLTAVIMVIWALWLKKTPHRADEETGSRSNQKMMGKDSLKTSKND